eukprot:233804_1
MAMIMNILYNGYLEILLQFYMVSVVMWCRFMSLPVMSKSYQHIHIKRQKYKGNKGTYDAVTYGKEQQAKGEVGEQQKEKTQQSKRKVGKGTYEKNKRSKKKAKENTTNEKVNIHIYVKGKIESIYNQSEGNMGR